MFSDNRIFYVELALIHCLIYIFWCKSVSAILIVFTDFVLAKIKNLFARTDVPFRVFQNFKQSHLHIKTLFLFFFYLHLCIFFASPKILYGCITNWLTDL